MNKTKSDTFILVLFLLTYLAMGFGLVHRLDEKPFNMGILKARTLKLR